MKSNETVLDKCSLDIVLKEIAYQNWMGTLEMAPLFWNYLFPETHVADQLDWK
jgi:hypothetical protein